MKQEDSDIKEYFNNMKQSEANHIDIPPFNIPKKSPKRRIYSFAVPLAIAASLLLFFGVPSTTPNAEIQNDTLLITLTVDANTNTDDLMPDETSISNWKSPTSILIQEFED